MLPPGRAAAHPVPLFLREGNHLSGSRKRAKETLVPGIAVDVGEAEVRVRRGWALQVPVVRLVLHNMAHALVDDHLADYVGARPRM